MIWEQISNIILGAAIAILAVFAIIGLVQWISRKSLKKVDYQLLYFPIPLVIMTIVYLIFNYLVVLNTRPNGSGESSFPSTHVMVTATIFLMIATTLPHYIKSKVLCGVIYALMLILIALISVARVLSNMHWPLDVTAGIVFAIIFDEVYYLLLLRHRKAMKKPKKATNE